MINVTKTYLPPLEEYTTYLQRIWESGQITNNGPLLKELEQRLKEYLGVKHLFLTANGTIGLQIALRALGVTGKVITTPFSYVATTGALLWEHCTPVFADINPNDFCLDPAKIEASINAETQAILAVHVYGYACDVAALDEIARRHGLKVIYDAAHAFGSRLAGRSLASYGDVSVLSFHATKLFHTVEGGAVITDDDHLAAQIRLCRAFGHIGDDYLGLGINAKNSEFHAAMGLCLLPRIQELIAMRQNLSARYDEILGDLPLQRPQASMAGLEYNHAYYPVVFPTEESLLAAMATLAARDIVARRYFYPALNRLPYRPDKACPVAESIAARVLCLPLSYKVDAGIQSVIASLLRECLVP